MKKIFTLILGTVIIAVLFTACTKQYVDVDESYWLRQERGTVVYADPYCRYYVVETYNGYSVLREWNGYKPYQGDVVYGNFSNYGTRDFYNRSRGFVYTSEVNDYWLSYFEAQNAVDYYCY